MAASRTSSKPAPPPSPLERARRADRLRRAVRGLLHGGGVLTALVVGWTTLDHARQHVAAAVRPTDPPPRIVLKDRPGWMSDLVVERITRTLTPVAATDPFDHALLRDRYRLFEHYPWVETVHSVRRVYGESAGDTLEIDADFRVPAALVGWHGRHWLVDQTGVMLPEGFTDAQIDRVTYDENGTVNVRRLTGVATRPVGEGTVWPGDDVQDGLELLAFIASQPFAEDVIGVDVSNHGGRRDPRSAELELLTRWSTRVRWGRPLAAGETLAEVPVVRKVYALNAVREQYGRVDAGFEWIDVRYDDVARPR